MVLTGDMLGGMKRHSLFFGFIVVMTIGTLLLNVTRPASKAQPLRGPVEIPPFSADVCQASPVPVPENMLGLAALSIAEPEAQALIRDLSVEMVRVEFRWDEIEPEKGGFEWERHDEIVRFLTNEGVYIMATVDWAPVWSHDSRTLAADFQAFITTLVERYGDSITLFEVFNEPNLPGYGWSFGSDDREFDARLYASVLVAANEGIRSARPDAHIMIGGLSHQDDAGAYIDALYQHLAPDCFDVFSYHPYGQGARLVELQAELRAQLARNGDAGKPIWFGEFGTSDQEYRAPTLAQVRSQLSELDGLVWFSLRDLKPVGWNFGLVEYDWEARPEYEQFKTIVAEHKQRKHD
jgi:hypothetical protein